MEPNGSETYPLTEHPVLAEVARALNEAGAWAHVVDEQWRLVYATAAGARADRSWRVFPGPEYVSMRLDFRGGFWELATARETFRGVGPWMLADAPGGREELRDRVDSRLRDIVDELSAADYSTAIKRVLPGWYAGGRVSTENPVIVMRTRDPAGQVVGTVIQNLTAVGMAAVGAMIAMGDVRHVERMQHVSNPARRPAAILFADLEASSPLSRRLSTASYFALGRRLVRAADQCVIDAGGLVGRHVGDGVVAFFLAESAGSESAAARLCIDAARAPRTAACMQSGCGRVSRDGPVQP